jgi:hypothetical protein
MRAKWWTLRRLVPSFATALSAGIIVAASVPAGAASASAGTLGVRAPATSTQTCSFYRSHEGLWNSIEANSNKKYVWTVSGSYIYLEPFTNSLSQCWKLIGGFGNGEFEYENAYVEQCISNAKPKSKGNLVSMSACLSKSNEKYQNGAPAADDYVILNTVEDTNLCIAADPGISEDANLDIATCSNSKSAMDWYINTSP